MRAETETDAAVVEEETATETEEETGKGKIVKRGLVTAGAVRFSCDPWKNQCTATTDRSGYKSLKACQEDCSSKHDLALGLTISLSIVVVLVVVLTPTLVTLHKKGKI